MRGPLPSAQPRYTYQQIPKMASTKSSWELRASSTLQSKTCKNTYTWVVASCNPHLPPCSIPLGSSLDSVVLAYSSPFTTQPAVCFSERHYSTARRTATTTIKEGKQSRMVTSTHIKLRAPDSHSRTLVTARSEGSKRAAEQTKKRAAEQTKTRHEKTQKTGGNGGKQTRHSLNPPPSSLSSKKTTSIPQ